MNKITLIIGLPGSGKTTYAKKNFDCKIIDDPRDLDELPDELTEDLVITDPHLCVFEYQCLRILRAKYKEFEFDKIYFLNDPEQCKINNIGRDRKVDALIDLYSKTYTPIYQYKNMSVYKE